MNRNRRLRAPTYRFWAVQLTIVNLLIVAALFGACAKKVAIPHPNQINSFDGATYDTLTAAQATLDEAKVQYKSGALPATAKPVINAGGAAYETARTSWQTWRDITLGVRAGDPAAAQLQLQSDMTALAQAIANVARLVGGK